MAHQWLAVQFLPEARAAVARLPETPAAAALLRDPMTFTVADRIADAQRAVRGAVVAACVFGVAAFVLFLVPAARPLRWVPLAIFAGTVVVGIPLTLLQVARRRRPVSASAVVVVAREHVWYWHTPNAFWRVVRFETSAGGRRRHVVDADVFAACEPGTLGVLHVHAGEVVAFRSLGTGLGS